MKPWTPIVLGLALCAGAAQAQPVNEDPPISTIICLDVSGRSLPATCNVPGSRLDRREYICLCNEGQRVAISICPAGVRAPPDGLALMRARRDAVRAGSLIGATFEGRPMCVAPRQMSAR